MFSKSLDQNKEENQTNLYQRRVLKFLEFWEIVAGATEGTFIVEIIRNTSIKNTILFNPCCKYNYTNAFTNNVVYCTE